MTDNKISTDAYHGLARNSFWVMVSNISMFSVLLITVFASRTLGDELFGKYVFLLAVNTVLADISVLGMTDYAAILVARERPRTASIVANALGLRIPFAAIFLAVSQLVIWFSMPEAQLAGLIIALDWVVRTVIHLMRGILRSRNAFSTDARVATIERGAVLLCTAIALYSGGGLISFALGFLAGRLFGVVACFRAYTGLGEHLYLSLDTQEWRNLLRGGAPIGLRGILKGLSFRIDAIMLGLFREASELGWYGAAYKLLEASFFFQEAVNTSFQPAISRAYGRSDHGLAADLYGRAYKLMLILGGVLAATAFLFADPLILLLFGEEFARSSGALEVLVWAMVFMFASTTSCTLLDAVESGIKTVRPYAIAAVANIVLNLALIPRYGYMGAAWSTLATELFLAVSMLKVSHAKKFTIPGRWLYGPIIACSALLGVALTIDQPHIVGLLLGCISFALLIVWLGVLDRVDTRYLKFLLSKIRSIGSRNIADSTPGGGNARND